MKLLRLVLVAAACLAGTGCADRPVVYLEFGTPRVQDCVAGSISRPCE